MPVAVDCSLQQAARPINRLVQRLDGSRVVPSPQRLRLIGEFTEFANGFHQLIKRELAVFDGFTHAVFHDPALKIDRFSRRRRKLDARHVLQDPPDLLQISSNSLSRISRYTEGYLSSCVSSLTIVWRT
jgi:hypothetical protein